MSNEYWSGNALGRFFGARRAEIPLSSVCATGDEVPFTGSIGSADDRVGYYHSLMDGFSARSGSWHRSTLAEIMKQGR